MLAPTLPFLEYKWRWASFQPTEGLNEPSVFLGVLRTLYKFSGDAPSESQVSDALQTVKEETGTRVDLARTPERNLIRNSGQYWKATGLLKDIPGRIELTSFGVKVALGQVTRAEFASTIVKTLTLPNPRIFAESEMKDWKEAGLRIKPLELILTILSELHGKFGPAEGYITPRELIGIVIPMAGNKAKIIEFLDAIKAFRENKLSLESWPDCAPGANDKRMANEFLLFLAHYGFCERRYSSDRRRDNIRYYLSEIAHTEIINIEDITAYEEDLERTAKEIRASELPAAVEVSLVERERTLTTRISRSGQAKFRRDVLRAFGNKCFFTEESLEAVLEAPHIIPVKHNGPDVVQNGLCLRADIHLLFDASHIRIQPSGDISYSDVIAESITYKNLPSYLDLPQFIDRQALEWRLKYY